MTTNDKPVPEAADEFEVKKEDPARPSEAAQPGGEMFGDVVSDKTPRRKTLHSGVGADKMHRLRRGGVSRVPLQRTFVAERVDEVGLGRGGCQQQREQRKGFQSKKETFHSSLLSCLDLVVVKCRLFHRALQVERDTCGP